MNIGLKVRGVIDYYFGKKNEKNIVSVNIPKYSEELLKGKIAFIVGGTGGIGKAIAESFISSGAKVVISGTNKEKVCKTVEQLGENAKGIQVDLSQVSLFDDKVMCAIEQFPEKRIDILVNCAGVHGNQKFGNVSEGTYDMVMNINLKGLFFMTQAVGNYMKRNGIKGHILNVSSAAALKPGYTPYEISKNAVKSFTLGAAAELIDYGIVVNAIAPGPVATSMLGYEEGDTLYTECVPAKRFATPLEIAQLAVIMVSDICNLVIGDTFYISGGSGTIKNR